ncbi:MAG TPA: DUF488 family protein [Candidatus Eisenbacteria bacterium]|nr:DUF488 family protein [Candidatus Eisenbacteria bacterium]
MIRTKRVYDKPSKEDGFRVLVDRLWPRGLTKENAAADLWLKEIAPSDELRKAFHEEKVTWKEFEKKYRAELRKKNPQLEEIRRLEKKHGTVTLVYGRNDEKQNQAVVIAELLRDGKNG